MFETLAEPALDLDLAEFEWGTAGSVPSIDLADVPASSGLAVELQPIATMTAAAPAKTSAGLVGMDDLR